MYSLTDILLFCGLALAFTYWWRSRELHALALASARHYCKERGIQLLDETLFFDKFTLHRAANKKRYLGRVYSFDFCLDGTDRHKGQIILRGTAVLSVVLETEQLEITQY